VVKRPRWSGRFQEDEEMSNHSGSDDYLKDVAEKMGLGPTGAFPEGKLHPSDEGQIKIAIGNRDGKVVLAFGAPVAWIGFPPGDAEQIATDLLRHARTARSVAALAKFVEEIPAATFPGGIK
jgi:hypothetical protein